MTEIGALAKYCSCAVCKFHQYVAGIKNGSDTNQQASSGEGKSIDGLRLEEANQVVSVGPAQVDPPRQAEAASPTRTVAASGARGFVGPGGRCYYCDGYRRHVLGCPVVEVLKEDPNRLIVETLDDQQVLDRDDEDWGNDYDDEADDDKGPVFVGDSDSVSTASDTLAVSRGLLGPSGLLGLINEDLEEVYRQAVERDAADLFGKLRG